MALPDPFSCVAECRANIDSCNALIFDRWVATNFCKANIHPAKFDKRMGEISREAGECHLGWSSPPCDRSAPTTSVFLLQPASAFPCFREFSFSAQQGGTLNLNADEGSLRKCSLSCYVFCSVLHCCHWLYCHAILAIMQYVNTIGQKWSKTDNHG